MACGKLVCLVLSENGLERPRSNIESEKDDEEEHWPEMSSASTVLNDERPKSANTDSNPYADAVLSQPAPSLAAYSRTSWLPPLPFQPHRQLQALQSPSTAPSPDIPGRPLLRRSVTDATSISSSSFYSRSASDSEPPYSRPRSTTSIASDYSRYGSISNWPRRVTMTKAEPAVPPIPDKWKRVDAITSKIDTQIRPGPSPRLPHAGVWTFSTHSDLDSALLPPSISSWTDVSDSTHREPSFCKYPILVTSPPKPKESVTTPLPASDITMGKVWSQSPYESVRKGETKVDPPSSLHNQWLDLDDRREPKQKKRKVSQLRFSYLLCRVAQVLEDAQG